MALGFKPAIVTSFGTPAFHFPGSPFLHVLNGEITRPTTQGCLEEGHHHLDQGLTRETLLARLSPGSGLPALSHRDNEIGMDSWVIRGGGAMR